MSTTNPCGPRSYDVDLHSLLISFLFACVAGQDRAGLLVGRAAAVPFLLPAGTRRSCKSALFPLSPSCRLYQLAETVPCGRGVQISPTTFSELINDINALLIRAHNPTRTWIDNSLAILTLYLSTLVVRSHYQRVCTLSLLPSCSFPSSLKQPY